MNDLRMALRWVGPLVQSRLGARAGSLSGVTGPRRGSNEPSAAKRVVRAALFLGCFALVSVAPAHGTTLFGLVDTGELFASSDMGVTWQVRSTLPVRDAVGIGAASTSSELYLASRSGMVYRSEDAGDTWDAVGSVAASDIVDLAVRSDGAVLLLAESGAVYISTDQGASFTAQAALTGSDFVSLCVKTASEHYVLARTGEVAESVDGGVNWVTKGVITVSNAANLRAMGGTLYVLTGTGGVFRSEDDGGTWSPVGTLSQVHMSGFTTDGFQLVAATREGEVAISPDGVSWQWRGAINQLSVVALGTDEPPITGIEGPRHGPSIFTLGQNYPNPFGPGAPLTHIPLVLNEPARVQLRIFDMRGRLVATLVDGNLTAEAQRIPWNGIDDGGRVVAAGVYSYELRCRDRVDRRKMVVVR